MFNNEEKNNNYVKISNKNIENENIKLKQLKIFLNSIEYFKKLKSKQLNFLLNNFEVKTYNFNDIIFKQNSEISKLYLIKKGQFILIYNSTKNKKINFDIEHFIKYQNYSNEHFNNQRKYELTGKYVIKNREKILMLTKGEFFGEIEMYLKCDKSFFDVVCNENNSEIISIDRNEFEKVMYYILPQMKIKILEKISIIKNRMNDINNNRNNNNFIIKKNKSYFDVLKKQIDLTFNVDNSIILQKKIKDGINKNGRKFQINNLLHKNKTEINIFSNNKNLIDENSNKIKKKKFNLYNYYLNKDKKYFKGVKLNKIKINLTKIQKINNLNNSLSNKIEKSKSLNNIITDKSKRNKKNNFFKNENKNNIFFSKSKNNSTPSLNLTLYSNYIAQNLNLQKKDNYYKKLFNRNNHILNNYNINESYKNIENPLDKRLFLNQNKFNNLLIEKYNFMRNISNISNI